MGGVSADQALRSYKWSYIRLAALHLRWQNLWSYWAIAVVLTLLGRTIFSLFDIFEQCQRITIGRCAWGVCVIEASGGLLTAGSQIRVHKPLNGLLDLLLTSPIPLPVSFFRNSLDTTNNATSHRFVIGVILWSWCV
jgi:hypothetical protein